MAGQKNAGGVNDLRDYFIFHPLMEYKRIAFFNEIGKLPEENPNDFIEWLGDSFATWDVVKMDKTMDERHKFGNMLLFLMKYSMPNVWTLAHEATLFMYMLLMFNNMYPHISVSSRGHVLITKIFMPTGTPFTTKHGENYQKRLKSMVSIELASRMYFPIWVNMNYGDDAFPYFDPNGTPRDEFQEVMESIGVQWDAESCNGEDGYDLAPFFFKVRS